MRPSTEEPRSRLLSRAGGVSIGAVLGAAAALRRGKAVHPTGVVYDAYLSVFGAAAAPPAARLLAEAGHHRALVRFSRSLGLPRPLPDLLGMSIRLPDVYGAGRHQDFLLVTSADLPIVHHLFLPANEVQQRPYSSSLPYRAGDRRFIVGALPQSRSPRPGGADEFERLDAAAATGELRYTLAVAGLLGRFQAVGEVTIGRRLAPELDALRFNPWNTGGGMVPVGALNGARDRSYKLSQAAWRRTRPNGALLQDAADREQRRTDSPGTPAPRRPKAVGRRG